MRVVGIAAFALVSFLVFTSEGQAEPPMFFSQRPVVLSITTLQPGVVVSRSLDVETVKRAITRFMGNGKKAQIYLLQKFLTDAKSKVQMQLQVEEDIFEINNGLPQKPDTLLWTIRLTSDAKVRALLEIIDTMSIDQKPVKKEG